MGAVVSRARRLDEERVDEDLDEFVHLKTRPNHVLVLLDGDGYAFRPSLIFEGRKGGVKAAELLAHSVWKTLGYRTDYRMSVYLICNKEGLAKHLSMGGITKGTTKETRRALLEDFWQGFQEPLSNFVVDSGRAKESADHKLKELYRNHIRSPETLKIILGVANDNGYAPLLRSEVIPLFRNRLILLDWHGPFTRDIATLGLPSMHIPDLFFPSLSEWEREREAEREAEEEVVKEREEEAKKEKEKEAENAGRREVKVKECKGKRKGKASDLSEFLTTIRGEEGLVVESVEEAMLDIVEEAQEGLDGGEEETSAYTDAADVETEGERSTSILDTSAEDSTATTTTTNASKVKAEVRPLQPSPLEPGSIFLPLVHDQLMQMKVAGLVQAFRRRKQPRKEGAPLTWYEASVSKEVGSSGKSRLEGEEEQGSVREWERIVELLEERGVAVKYWPKRPVELVEEREVGVEVGVVEELEGSESEAQVEVEVSESERGEEGVEDKVEDKVEDRMQSRVQDEVEDKVHDKVDEDKGVAESWTSVEMPRLEGGQAGTIQMEALEASTEPPSAPEVLGQEAEVEEVGKSIDSAATSQSVGLDRKPDTVRASNGGS